MESYNILTIKDNLGFWVEITTKSIWGKIKKRTVGIDDNTPFLTYSDAIEYVEIMLY